MATLALQPSEVYVESPTLLAPLRLRSSPPRRWCDESYGGTEVLNYGTTIHMHVASGQILRCLTGGRSPRVVRRRYKAAPHRETPRLRTLVPRTLIHTIPKYSPGSGPVLPEKAARPRAARWMRESSALLTSQWRRHCRTGVHACQDGLAQHAPGVARGGGQTMAHDSRWCSTSLAACGSR